MRLVALIAALLLPACGLAFDGGEHPDLLGFGPQVDAAGLDLAMEVHDLRRPPPDMAFVYPPGPYGRSVGDVLADVVADGYPLEPGVRLRDTTYQVVRLSTYLKHSSCFCLLVVQDAFWSMESWQLMRELGRAAADKGLCVLEALDEGLTQGVRANEDDVTQWANEFGADFPIVRGGPATASVLPVVYRYPSLTTVKIPSMRIALHRVGLQNKPIEDALGVCPTN